MTRSIAKLYAPEREAAGHKKPLTQESDSRVFKRKAVIRYFQRFGPESTGRPQRVLPSDLIGMDSAAEVDYRAASGVLRAVAARRIF
jgi:hypothetical protein